MEVSQWPRPRPGRVERKLLQGMCILVQHLRRGPHVCDWVQPASTNHCRMADAMSTTSDESLVPAVCMAWPSHPSSCLPLPSKKLCGQEHAPCCSTWLRCGQQALYFLVWHGNLSILKAQLQLELVILGTPATYVMPAVTDITAKMHWSDYYAGAGTKLL